MGFNSGFKGLKRCYNTQRTTVNQVAPCVGHVVVTGRRFKNGRSFAKMVQLSGSLNGNTRTHMHAHTHTHTNRQRDGLNYRPSDGRKFGLSRGHTILTSRELT